MCTLLENFCPIQFLIYRTTHLDPQRLSSHQTQKDVVIIKSHCSHIPMQTLMRRNTQSSTIRSSLHRITIVPRIIMTLHRLVVTRYIRESTTHLVLDANSQTIARRATSGCVRVRNARVAFVAKEIAWTAAAAQLVRVRREGCGCGCGRGRRCGRRWTMSPRFGPGSGLRFGSGDHGRWVLWRA
jgi:hypothetical protein